MSRRGAAYLTVVASEDGDVIAPTLTIAFVSIVGNVASMSITASEEVSGFAVGDITITAGGSLANFETADNVTFTVDWTLANGANTMDIAAEVCEDLAGNPNTAATQYARSYASTILPTLGAEQLVNPGLEGTYVDGKAPSWNKIGTSTLAEENTIIHGGAASQKITGAADTDGVYVFMNAFLTAGQWVRLSGWGYEASGAFTLDIEVNGDARGKLAVSGAAWEQFIRTGKFISSTVGFWPQQVGAGATVGYVDDCSLKIINVPSMFGTFRYTTTTGDVTIATKIKVSTLTQIGAWLNVDDPDNPTNGVCIVVDGEKIFIYKLVSGTWTTVVNGTTIAWTDYDELRITKVGTSYKVFRNDYPLVSATISDATVVDQVNHVQFSTDERNVFQTFQVTDIVGTVLAKVTTLGDSITAGATTVDWPQYFSTLHNYGAVTLVNRAVSGADILGTGSFDTQVTASASDDADIIIIALGTNDNSETGRQAEYEENLNELIASNADAVIYCMGILPCTSGNAYTAGKVAAINTAIQAAATATGATYLDTTGWIDPATQTTDGLHPTAAGALAIAQALVAALT